MAGPVEEELDSLGVPVGMKLNNWEQSILKLEPFQTNMLLYCGAVEVIGL